MNEDFKYIAQYLDDSELVINLKRKKKKKKTDSMMFGTAKRLQTVNNFNVFYRFNIINQVNSYVYLRNTIDSSLNLNENLDKKYKKASSRMQLLTKVDPIRIKQELLKYSI